MDSLGFHKFLFIRLMAICPQINPKRKEHTGIAAIGSCLLEMDKN